MKVDRSERNLTQPVATVFRYSIPRRPSAPGCFDAGLNPQTGIHIGAAARRSGIASVSPSLDRRLGMQLIKAFTTQLAGAGS
jgi:hypothetical protein